MYLSGRTKDVVIHAGRNIYPQELEERVGDLPGVRKGCVAVFGVRDAASGTERLVVLAETRATDDAERAPLRARVYALAADLLGTPPDEVVFVPPHTVPKTSSGKIRRAAARELYERGPLGAAPRAGVVAGGATVGRGRGARAAAAAARGRGGAVRGLCLGVVRAGGARSLVRGTGTAAAVALAAAGARRQDGVRGARHPRRGARPRKPAVRARGILVANHASYLDGIVLTAVLPRPARFVAKAEFARHPLVGPFLRGLDAEFVERFDRQLGVADARHAARAARAGHTLLFFPRAPSPAGPGCRRSTSARSSRRPRPTSRWCRWRLRGTRSILRDGSWFPRRGAVTVTVGAPLAPRALAGGEGPWAAALKLRDAARAHILRHIGEPDLAGEAPRF